MLKLKKVYPPEVGDVSVTPDYLASSDINFSIIYDVKKHGDLRREVCYFRYHSGDGRRLMVLDIDKYYGFLLRVESPNLEIRRTSNSCCEPTCFDRGIPSLFLDEVCCDSKLLNENTMDTTQEPFLELHRNGVVYKMGYPGVIKKIISPCEDLYLHFLENDVLAEITMTTNDSECLERLAKERTLYID